MLLSTMMSSSLKVQRVSAPCNDRQTIYDAMAKWSFKEANQINFNLLDWIEKTVLVHQPKLTESQMPDEMFPQKFLELVASQNGIWLKRLAIRLGSSKAGNIQNRNCYEMFYEFAKEDAKLAEGCIFLKEELLGDSPSHEDYKSVFYTLYKLANQARDKFGVPILAETQQIGWPELNKKEREVRKKCAEREELDEMMVNWGFEEVKKKNGEIIQWLKGNGAKSTFGISSKKFLAIFSTNAGKKLLQNLSETVAFPAEEFYDNFSAFAKSQLPNACIFWESELYGTGYEDYKSVFCTLHMLMKKNVPAKSNDSASATSSANSNSQRQPKSKEGVQIFVKTVTGKVLTMEDCHPSKDSVQQFKARISAKVGTPVEEIRLIFAGNQLEDGRILQEYKVQKESTIHVVQRLKGC